MISRSLPSRNPDAAAAQPEVEPAAPAQQDSGGGTATPVLMPELGESVAEGTVTRWLKKVGDSVQVDEPLVEVSTDKVDTEIPSPVAGVLVSITADEDATVAVGGELARIGVGTEAGAPAAPAPQPPPAPAPAPAPAPVLAPKPALTSAKNGKQTAASKKAEAAAAAAAARKNAVLEDDEDEVDLLVKVATPMESRTVPMPAAERNPIPAAAGSPALDKILTDWDDE